MANSYGRGVFVIVTQLGATIALKNYEPFHLNNFRGSVVYWSDAFGQWGSINFRVSLLEGEL